MSDLERDLEDLEASDPAVKQAAERLDETITAIVAEARSADSELRRREVASALGFNGESTSARLRRVEQENEHLRGDFARVRAERDELSAAVAGWVARFHAAYEALYIEEFDGDSCPDLESTIEYAIGAYRRVCESEAAAADEARRLRNQLGFADSRIRTVERERDSAQRESDRREETVARNVRERDQALDARDAVREQRDEARAELASARTDLRVRIEQVAALRASNVQLRAQLGEATDELERLRYSGWCVSPEGGRYCERCEQEVRRGEAYSLQPGTGGLIQHIHCPTPTEGAASE